MPPLVINFCFATRTCRQIVFNDAQCPQAVLDDRNRELMVTCPVTPYSDLRAFHEFVMYMTNYFSLGA